MTASEIKNITQKFLSKHSAEISYKLYPFGEKVCCQGERTASKIYIVKEGVFKIGKVDTPEFTNTLGFCFEGDIRAPLGIFIPNVQSLYEIKSIENSLVQCNSLYEIPLEQWNAFVAEDETLNQLLINIFCNNWNNGMVFLATLRQNRKMKELFYKMYDTRHPVLISGIADEYIAEFFGIPVKSYKRMYNDKLKLERSKKEKAAKEII